jgi:methionyl aminopeptidase
MSIESPEDAIGIRRAGRAVAAALRVMEAAIRAGVSTADLDAVGHEVLRRHGAQSAPRLVYGFPGINLISVNDEIVHGIPGGRRLQPGDVVKLDVTAELAGYVADAAVTAIVPPAADTARLLRDCAVRAFRAGASVARAGVPVAEIGAAVEATVIEAGFAVVRELTGHGVGRTIHEPPNVPNYRDRHQRDVLTAGLVLTIEPIIAERRCRVVQDADGWTLRTSDGSLAAHHEHTIVITAAGAEILTTC